LQGKQNYIYSPVKNIFKWRLDILYYTLKQNIHILFFKSNCWKIGQKYIIAKNMYCKWW